MDICKQGNQRRLERKTNKEKQDLLSFSSREAKSVISFLQENKNRNMYLHSGKRDIIEIFHGGTEIHLYYNLYSMD